MVKQWMRGMGTGVALTLVLGGGAALAQTKPATGAESGAKSGAGSASTAASEPAKIGTVNLRAAIATTAEGKQAAQQLETQFAERRKELEDLNKKINDLQQRLQTGGTNLSEDERSRLTTEGQKLTRQLDRRQNDFQEDLGEAQNEVVQRIGRRMVEVIGKFAPGNGYTTVLDNSAQGSPVMYAATDLTDQLVKLYDQTYPAKTAAAPAAAKPPAKPSEK